MLWGGNSEGAPYGVISVLQCVAVCNSALQRVTLYVVRCGML